MSKDAIERSKRARAFVERWRGRGDEKSDTQKFWIDLLSDVCGVERPTETVTFEKRVELAHKSFIDAYIPATRVLIEQKSSGIDLDEAAHQSDGTSLTPFQQAMRYNLWLPYDERPRWVVVSDFKEIRVHDMMSPRGAPEIILLEDLPKDWRKLAFLADPNALSPSEIVEQEISIAAGELVGRLYDAVKKGYVDPDAPGAVHGLNVLCVRLVFLLYAEDADLIPKDSFHGYLSARRTMARRALIDLFDVLDQRKEDRDPYLDDDLAAFPYVDGGLFEERGIEIPQLGDEALGVLLDEMSRGFDWSGISPTIFGAVFESTLTAKRRRAGGMHYTSPENIHRAIDPLFLDGLEAELATLLKDPKGNAGALKNFQARLASLTFLDPACGSGNFLTETYISLRRLENEILRALDPTGQIKMIFSEGEDPVKVSIKQFFGIEIDGFAVAVARTALWIAEAKMMGETRDISRDLSRDVLPLKSYPNIVQGNALRMDWRELVPAPSFIMGNPPFVGHQWRSKAQQEDLDIVCQGIDSYGKLDYVCAWYFKAAEILKDESARAAFVSTNSIVQGESVGILWRPMFERFGVHIDFAWRTFRWGSETKGKDMAHVHVVIIGFSCGPERPNAPRLFDVQKDGTVVETHAKNINGYLLDAPNVFIKSRGKPLDPAMPPMSKGSQPTDGGRLILSSDEAADLIEKHPKARALVRPYMGADEFINGTRRYCLWLKGVPPVEYHDIAPITERLRAVREARADSPTASVRRDADTPMLFTQIRQPETDYLVVPEVSSHLRQYIPIGYLAPDIISSNKLYIIPRASLYMFGVLISDVHMAWMRVVAGRLGIGYSYSPAVYNNFPWPDVSEEQREKIGRAAQGILDARAMYPTCSLSVLYDEAKGTMPPELRKAHRANDVAVRAAYGFPKDMSEPEIVATLMEMWRERAGA